jgi:hypothetical protein
VYLGPKSDSAELVSENVQVSQAGMYRVVVSNQYGEVQSEGAKLEVEAAPKIPSIESQPQGQTVSEGTRVVLRVEASGAEPLSYRWKRDGVFFGSKSPSSELVLENVQVSQAGIYRVEVSNEQGMVLSEGAKLVVQEGVSQDRRHPADVNPGDYRLAIGEVTSYGAAWKKGEQWSEEPVVIGIGYVTRAGYLWKKGERYRYDANAGEEPLCWVLDTGQGGGNRPVTKMGPLESVVRSEINLSGEFEHGVIRLELGWDDNISCKAFELVLSDNLKARNISHGGSVDETSGKLRWGPFMDGVDRTLSVTLDGSSSQGTISRIIYSVDGVESQFALMSRHQPIQIPHDSPKLVYESNDRLILFGQPGGLFKIQFVDRLNDQWQDLRAVRLDEWHKTFQLAPASTGTRFYRALMVD